MGHHWVMDTPRSATAAKVVAAVASANLTRRDLADATGIPYTTLFRKLNGHSSFTLDEIASVAAALNVEPTSLLAFEAAA